MDKIFCETHRCSIGETGCVKRQIRAKDGLAPTVKGVVLPGSRGVYIRGVPYDSRCLDCEQGKAIAKALKGNLQKPKRPKLEAPPGMKVCRKCKETKPMDDFPINTRMKDNRGRFCKACNNTHAKAVAARKKEEREAACPN